MTTPDLQLTLDAPARLALDEPLVAVARLAAGSRPITTSSRLNLLEGDLSVVVTGPGRRPVLAAWPYPVDSGLRRATLAPGEVLEGGVLLLAGAGQQQLFPAAGRYELVPEFSPTPAETVTGRPIAVLREEPDSAEGRARARAIADPHVIDSLTSASVAGSAAAALAVLAGHGAAPSGRLLAALATGDPAGIRAAATALAERSGAVAAAATAVAVLPPGLFPSDERLAAIAAAVAGRDRDGRAAALLAGRPWRPLSA